MKKSNHFSIAMKFVLLLGALLGIPAAINHLIFKRADKKLKSKITEAYYEWRHGNIRYITAGSGQPLLLIHGMTPGSGLHEWERSISILSRHYKVYALDLLGFGYSDKPGIAYSSYLFITLINDFIQTVIGKKVLMAASGTSGAYAVMAYSFRPELYRKILLVSPFLDPADVNGKRNLTGRLMELPVLGTAIYNIMTSKAYIRWFLKKHCLSGSDNLSAIVKQYYHAAHFGGVNAKYPIAAFLSDLLSVSARDKLAKVKIPVHMVCGSGYIPEEPNPSVGLTIVEGGKLWLHMENPKTFYKICRGFYK